MKEGKLKVAKLENRMFNKVKGIGYLVMRLVNEGWVKRNKDQGLKGNFEG